jgi:pimeloyl-ACP methyl ester carboxylesterase
MNTPSHDTGAAIAGAIGLAALASAAFVEQRSRAAERDHHAPHHLIYIQGTRLHYRLVGEGPPVLLIHGNLVEGADFEASGLVERLARHYQVLVIDRPGFGHSARPREIAWTPAQQARLLHQAAAALGVERPVVVAHSLGVQVALTMALHDPGSIAGLVLVSGYYWPTFRLDRWIAAPVAVPVLGDVLRYTTAAWTARAMLDTTIRKMFDPVSVPERFLELVPREMMLRPLQQRATAEDGSRMVSQARVLRQRYADMRMPLTLIAGAEDRIVSPQQAERLHRMLPQSHLRVLPGVGHMAHYHAHEQIVAGIEEALAAGRAGLVHPSAVARPHRIPAEPLAQTTALPSQPDPVAGP